MAAFIQKLFKSRKTPEATGKIRKETPAPEVQQEDTRANLREEQRDLLTSSPGQSKLAELALQGVTADIRLEAASQLTDTETLQHVQKKAKGRDKSVYQTVRQTLQQLREEQAERESLSQTITTLINQASDQARSDDTKLFEARLETLTRQWANVEPHASADETKRFLEAVHRCKERLENIHAAQAMEAHQKEQLLQREETLTLLAATLEDLQSEAPDPLPSLASLDALQKTQENRWLEATRETSVDKHQQKAYEASMLTLRNYINAVRRTTQEKDAIVALTAATESGDGISDEQREQAKGLVREISWPEGFPMPVLLEPLRQLAGKRTSSAPAKTADLEKQKAIAADLENTINSLEAALEAKQLKESRQLLKTVQQQFKSLDGRQGKPFHTRIQLLTGQLRELSDWLGFATEPKQIELCEQMEYLAEQPMEPEAKAERIKEFQNEWRNLGGSSDRALWTRFKAASDKAYEPCKDYFSAKSGLKRANLEKRQAICDQLAHFVEHADWTSIDWKSAEKIHLTARQEWKAAWPVEFRENRQVQKRFDELLRQLEAPLDQERQKNEALKQAIVDKANALIDHEPLQEAMNAAKDLQTEWKAVGITRHREDRKLWQAFRQACDQIFARRDTQRNEQQQATQEADDGASAALQETAHLTSDSDEQALSEALAKLRDLQSSALSSGLQERLQSEKKRLTKALADQRLKASISTWQALTMARTNGQVDTTDVPQNWPELAAEQEGVDHDELVIRAEILGGIASPESDQQRRMEIQVQRLAQGMGSIGPVDDQLGELEKLVAIWCLNPSDRAPDPALAQRLSDALASLTPA